MSVLLFGYSLQIIYISDLFYFGQENLIQSGHSLALLLHGPFLSLNDFWIFPKLILTR